MNEQMKKPDDALIIYDDPLYGIKEIVEKGLDTNVLFQSLFKTPQGRNYAKQVEEQKHFTTVGIIFPLVQELLMRITPHLPEIMRDKELQGWTTRKIDETKDFDKTTKEFLLKIVDAMKALDKVEPEIKSDFETLQMWGKNLQKDFLVVWFFHSIPMLRLTWIQLLIYWSLRIRLEINFSKL